MLLGIAWIIHIFHTESTLLIQLKPNSESYTYLVTFLENLNGASISELVRRNDALFLSDFCTKGKLRKYDQKLTTAPSILFCIKSKLKPT